MPIKGDIKKLISTEKKILGLIKQDKDIIEKKKIEKDLGKLLALINQQQMVDEQEIQQIEQELKEEEKLIDKEWLRATEEKKKKIKELEEQELLDEIHHLRIVYVLIPLIRQKNESLRKQKELLSESRGEFTIADLPMLIKKEQDALRKIRSYEGEAEQLLAKIQAEEEEKESLKL